MNFLKLEALATYDLDWYYNVSDSDIGIRSNWQATVNAATLGSPGWSDPYDNATLVAVDRKREIQGILGTLPPLQEKVLRASFSAERLAPPQLVAFFRSRALLALALSKVSPGQLVSQCARFQRGTATADERVSLALLKSKAEATYRQAIIDYSNARIQYLRNNQ
jgi:hypothetical protein